MPTNISLELGEGLDGSKILYLRDAKADIETTHRIYPMQIAASRYSILESFRSDLTQWIKDFCKFAYTDEDYVFELVRRATSKIPEARPGPVVSFARTLPILPTKTMFMTPPPREPESKPKKVKRAKLPVARVIKL